MAKNIIGKIKHNYPNFSFACRNLFCPDTMFCKRSMPLLLSHTLTVILSKLDHLFTLTLVIKFWYVVSSCFKIKSGSIKHDWCSPQILPSIVRYWLAVALDSQPLLAKLPTPLNVSLCAAEALPALLQPYMKIHEKILKQKHERKC